MKLLLCGALVAVGLCLMAGTARADSLVYIKDGNVWLANPDGSGQYQVTLDGTTSTPYRSPSQADDGTIVALRSGRLFRMKQNGSLLNEPIATAAPGSGPLHPAVSPDGRLVAFDYITAIPRPPSQGGGFKTEVIYTYSDRFTNRTEIDPAGLSFTDPSWLDNGHTMLFWGTQVWTDALDPSDEVAWWSDADHGMFEQLQDGEAAGTKIVLVRGANRETLQFYDRQGAGYGALPRPACGFNQPTGEFADPTLSPNAATAAWQEGDGVWVSPVPGAPPECLGEAPRLAIPGASEPDFGPANVNPGPRAAAPPPACCAATGDTTAPAITLKLKSRIKLGSLARGLRLAYRCSEPCSASATLSLDRRTARTLRLRASLAERSAPAFESTAALVLKPSAAVSHKLRRARVLKLTLTLRVANRAGNSGSLQRRITVSR